MRADGCSGGSLVFELGTTGGFVETNVGMAEVVIYMRKQQRNVR